MEEMSMEAREQYFKVLRKKYWAAKERKEKTRILDEYCANTGQNRKYVITKMLSDVRPKLKVMRKGKPVKYGGEVTAVLVELWKIFDYPCGERLKPVIEIEVDRLRQMKEIQCSDETAQKLKEISSATIDRKLRREKELSNRLRMKGNPRPGDQLKRKIAIRLTEWDISEVGNVEVDLVFHCGSSTSGEFLNTVSTTDIYSGWWDGLAIMGKSQDATFQALKRIRSKNPFEWKALDSDNGSEFINEVLYKYCRREGIEFTRSRPGRKNDNAYIEEKNWTHVRKVVGYLRYDTPSEQMIINKLYQQELSLYKNFFQPVIKLIKKERVGGKIKRKYDKAKTPYQRLIESGQLSEQAKLQLEAIYLSLNPAELKRRIDTTLHELFDTYQTKKRSPDIDPHKKVQGRSVRFYYDGRTNLRSGVLMI